MKFIRTACVLVLKGVVIGFLAACAFAVLGWFYHWFSAALTVMESVNAAASLL